MVLKEIEEEKKTSHTSTQTHFSSALQTVAQLQKSPIIKTAPLTAGNL